MSAPHSSASAQAVLDFWREAGPQKWFKKDEAFDAQFKARFEAAHEAAASGAFDHWGDSAEGSLALLVLLDQLPRNAWRNTARMYATDDKALEVARRAVDAGQDMQIEDPGLRAFFYLPFMHSESLADQERSVALCARADANNLRFAKHHRDIVARFGRFPHRNEVLGRESTAEESAFLAEGGFTG
ncbi:DUF924 family protein [Variovorax sp. OV329]|uniref:DUF924 family protein n=1 Tax=Variovorax sp. OV329 TaxID=1882825 RepID=UPI0008E71453|nr:DUF924 family protein [Variovorax sp. OV329]SFM55715.1 Uncharacterized conserved protein, DUF924 family [Variovorax sp. OV329]